MSGLLSTSAASTNTRSKRRSRPSDLTPDFPLTYRWLTAALAQAGRVDEAKEALEKAIAIAPASFDMYVRNRAPWMRVEDHAHILEGLRKPGWQE